MQKGSEIEESREVREREEERDLSHAVCGFVKAFSHELNL